MAEDEQEPDIGVPFRLVVIEESQDPIPAGADISNNYHSSSTSRKLCKVVKSVPFKIFTRGKCHVSEMEPHTVNCTTTAADDEALASFAGN